MWMMPLASLVPVVTTMSNNPRLMRMSASSAATRAMAPSERTVPACTMRGATIATYALPGVALRALICASTSMSIAPFAPAIDGLRKRIVPSGANSPPVVSISRLVTNRLPTLITLVPPINIPPGE